MVLWFFSTCCALTIKAEGSFPLDPLRKSRQPLCSCVLVPKGHILCFGTKSLFGRIGCLAGVRWRWGGGWIGCHDCLELGRGLMLGRVVGSQRRGSHPDPGGSRTLNGGWLLG